MIYYQAEVFVKGVRVAGKSFSQKREAVLWHEKEKQKFTSHPNPFNEQMLFKECVDKFWEDSQTRLMKSTIQSYECRLVYFISSPLSDLKMAEFKGMKIVDWISWLKQQPTAKNLGRKSFAKELAILKTILNWYKNYLNEDFNVPITKKHRQMCVFKKNPPRRPDYYMRPENVGKWVQWLKEHRSHKVYWRLAVFQLSTGARVGEACGLKWSEVDLKYGIARVIRRVRWDQISKKPVLEDVTKTAGSARILILPKGLVEILKEMKVESENELVFTNVDGEPLRYNAIQSAYNAGFEALGLPWRSTHICRHTYATLALIAGNSLSAVQAQPWSHRTEDHSKVCEGCRSFES